MRRLSKGVKPNVLILNEVTWTAEYVAAVRIGEGRKHERWRHQEIKFALNEETSGKCAYCEGLMGDISYPHVEHLVPKALRPELAHMWENLTWACPQCNVRKGDFYDPSIGILDPYRDEPDEYLLYYGDFVDWQLGNPRAEVTVRLLDLNRMDLVESRRRRLAAIKELLSRWHAASGAMREVLADAIRLDARDGEFTASVLAYLKHHRFPLDSDADSSGTEGAA